MRISDWSSDVCSSDLKIPARETLRYARAHPLVELEAAWRGDRFRQELAEDLARALVRAYERRSLDDETSRRAVVEDARLCVEAAIGEPVGQHGNAKRGPIRSEDRRVGEECGSTCRTRWSPENYKKKTKRNI